MRGGVSAVGVVSRLQSWKATNLRWMVQWSCVQWSCVKATELEGHKLALDGAVFYIYLGMVEHADESWK